MPGARLAVAGWDTHSSPSPWGALTATQLITTWWPSWTPPVPFVCTARAGGRGLRSTYPPTLPAGRRTSSG
eukprot:160413-Pyramimonas_sp.AAC.1